MSNQVQRLYRTTHDRMIGGVCGGLGQFFGIDPTVVRLTFAFAALFWPVTFLIYLIMMLVVPEELAASVETIETYPDKSVD